MKADKAWKIYNFINEYQDEKFGEISLQEALDEYYDSYVSTPPLKSQIGNSI